MRDRDMQPSPVNMPDRPLDEPEETEEPDFGKLADMKYEEYRDDKAGESK